MKYIILCGGFGKRLHETASFPKPLNHVLGVHSLKYILDSIPSDEIYIILNKNLKDYNIDTVLPHVVKKKYTCVYLERATRGPVETAYLGLQQLGISENEQVCFFDNDTIYDLNNIIFPSDTFIGYSTLKDINDTRPYCFLDISNNTLAGIAEKVKISNNYANGIYSFKTVRYFLDIAKKLLISDYTYNNEYYMSLLYDTLLKSGENIVAVNILNTICLGTPQDIVNNLELIPKNKLRICFDIDNTLIKYRSQGQNYADLEIIDKNVFFLREMKKLGHTIILHTARGMRTANNNLGLSLKNVAKDTFENLEKNNIPYDEIYFGKPDADMYIDDKAFNPYMNFYNSVGYGYLNEEYLKSKIPQNISNKFNLIYKKGSEIIKKGPVDSMKGEVFFYKTIQNTPISSLFPKFNWEKLNADFMNLSLNFIEGFTVYELLKDGLFTEKHLQQILHNFDLMHNYPGISIHITKDDIYQNYMGKLKKRVLNKKDYPFENTDELVKRIDDGVKEYLYNKNTYPVGVVHGDPWFSNTLLSDTNQIVFLDMKGDINGKLTTNGDALTDFGKIYQSLLGFDYIINGNTNINKEYINNLNEVFLNEMQIRGYNLNDLNNITACLISKTLSFLEVSLEVRTKIWNIVEVLINSNK